MKTDMSPEAVTMRLKQTSELRRLCLALGQREPEEVTESSTQIEGGLCQLLYIKSSDKIK